MVGLLLVGTITTAEARPATPPSPSRFAVVDTPDLASKGWQKVFEDEFASLNENNWHVVENDYSRRDAVTVDAGHTGEPADGFLRLRTYTENGRHYNGGIVNDQNDKLPHGLFNYTFGYAEARIKFDNQSGTTSDFWQLPAQGNRSYGDPGEAGPETGFEHINPDNDAVCSVDETCNEQPVGILGWDGYREDDHAFGARVENPNPAGPVLQGNFHTYGLLWSPEGWRYFIDGKQVYETTAGLTYRPEFMLMTQQVHGGWSGNIPAGGYGDLASTTNQTFVDYIRVWQRPISEVPNQVIGVNQAQAIPFSVTDRFFANPTTAEPDSVRVTATSSNTGLLPNGNINISGDGVADYDGSLGNMSFDNALATTATPGNWTAVGAATRSTTRFKTPSGGLRLESPGGKVTQTVTGLQPNTTYSLGGWADIEIEWTDADSDGGLDWTDLDEDGIYDFQDGPDAGTDPDEPGEAIGDADARFDWGVQDVDTAKAGDQTVKLTSERNFWTLGKNGFVHDYLTFTTGPTTTQATIFIDNQGYASPNPNHWDSKVSFDDIYLRPMVPPQRTVTVRPADGQTGTANVTLTARDENNTVLGTDTFAVKVVRDGFTNGGFDAMPEGKGWELWYGDAGKRLGADVVVDDPFSLNRVLQLAQPQIVDPRGPGQPGNHPGTVGTAFQRVSGLQPNAQYTLSVKAKGNMAFGFQGFTGTDPCAVLANCQVTTPDWSTKSITFTTDNTGSGSIVLLDWIPGDGASFVDDVQLAPVAPVAPAASAAPGLTSLGEQRVPSSAPAAVRFTRPSGASITGVSSNNQTLLPNRNLGIAGTGNQYVLSFTPVRDRTGTATVTVTYTGGGSKQILIVVTDTTLEAASFEGETTTWQLTGTGTTIAPGNQRSGANSLSVEGAGTATQRLIVHTQNGENGLHEWNRGFVVGGWGRDGATITVRELRGSCGFDPTPPCGPQVIGTYTWSGASLAYGQMVVRTGIDDCQGCRDQRAGLEIIVTDANGGSAAYLDDLSFMHGPHMSAIRDLSLFTGQTQEDWESRTSVLVGRIPLDVRWQDPSMVQIASSNPSVVPLANIKVQPDARNPMAWSFLVTAPSGTPTGSSDVTVTLTDPRTGANVQRTFTVTVSSGDFNNGAFQRGSADWSPAWFPPVQWNVGELRTSGRPTNFDSVLKMSQGAATYRVQNLQAGGSYILTGRAFGNGASVTVRKAKLCYCSGVEEITTQPYPVTAGGTWQNFSVPFTVPAGQTEAWISIEDFGYDDPALPAGALQCTTDYPGRSCYDDLMIVPAP